MKKKVIVTGGAGFLGSHLVDLLLEQGFHVFVLDDLSSGNESNLARWLDQDEDDLDDMKSIYQYSPGMKPRLRLMDIDITRKFVDNPWLGSIGEGEIDCIFHLAARMDVMSSFDDPFDDGMRNYIGTLNVLEFARKIKCPKIVYRSSFTIYSEKNPLPFKEQDEEGPISPYAMHKHHSEEILELYNKHYGMKNVSFRLFNLYGPRMNPKSIYSGVALRFLDLAIRGKDIIIYGDGDQTRDLVYVKDAVKVLYEGLVKDAVGVYNVGTGIEVRIEDLARKIVEITHHEVKIIHEHDRKGEIYRSFADVTKLKKELNIIPKTGLDEGLKETLEWLRTK